MSSLLNFSSSKLWKRSPKMKNSSTVLVDSAEAKYQGTQRADNPGSPVTIVVVGCGQRGKSYAKYAQHCPGRLKVVAIAEPRPKTRQYFAALHNVDKTLVFNTWQELLVASKETINTVGKPLADAVLIAVQDHQHAEVTKAFAEQGYHILCEKPMATSVQDCVEMERAVTKSGKIFGMGHVMRYSPYTQELTDIVRSGVLGELINVVQIEPVGYFHFAHSYVRGNWNNEANSSFSLMTKCCHDIDLLCHWFAPAVPVKVSSFGSLRHFRKDGKPKAAGTSTRCLDCPAERDCAYSAKKIYLSPVTYGNTGWPVETIVDGTPDIENVTHALDNGPYGLCVYESENDVCDNQVVNIEFSNGTTASFTMVAFTSAICERETRMYFSNGEIIGNMSTFTMTNFKTRVTKTHRPVNEGGGHGGGDMGLIRSFVEAVRTRQQNVLGTDAQDVLKSHLTVFAAEKSRREGRVVDCVEFEKEARKEAAEKEKDPFVV
ncbi:hypothetical protein CPB83DRAFT_866421 [Crepidotus variabilis]|uniref:Streptomycin biosynthesis protein StrI n=1 Tax=Crepidotus variabilis TaxID=179855 RepID=A0A9P6ES40_9AGAR|nr:hypothetical protein CPB83DRAFT_866421 [Crepidotus variabilis]